MMVPADCHWVPLAHRSIDYTTVHVKHNPKHLITFKQRGFWFWLQRRDRSFATQYFFISDFWAGFVLQDSRMSTWYVFNSNLKRKTRKAEIWSCNSNACTAHLWMYYSGHASSSAPQVCLLLPSSPVLVVTCTYRIRELGRTTSCHIIGGGAWWISTAYVRSYENLSGMYIIHDC